jgi:hypothetical protein
MNRELRHCSFSQDTQPLFQVGSLNLPKALSQTSLCKQPRPTAWWAGRGLTKMKNSSVLLSKIVSELN